VRCLYLGPTGDHGVADDPRLDLMTERHKIDLTVGPRAVSGDPIAVLDGDPQLRGIVMEMHRGWVGRARLRIAGAALAQRRAVWFYWPLEQAIERIDEERLASLWRHWLFITASLGVRRYVSGARRVLRDVPPHRLPGWALRRLMTGRSATADACVGTDRHVPSRAERLTDLNALIAAASPVPFAGIPSQPADGPIRGTGAYLRTDFWAKIESGGSYGHTCYVAKELAAVTEHFVCFLAHRYRLLEDFGVRQVVLDPPSATASEGDIVSATPHFYQRLKPAFEALRPAYIYERLCLGNYAGARLSHSLGIPYLVEYNGSEISMHRSFDGTGYIYEDEYIKAEELAFKQATMISVVSDEVKAGLVARKVSPDKILVNPNGADLIAYAPADPAEKRQIRSAVGLNVAEPVVGFTGTFGGWHGVDVLAAAIPQICARSPRVQFLLIGDGNYKHLVDKAIADYALHGQVVCTGRVPQAEGARLLKACDLFVSPHNSHMVDSRFFGSPTKIFEYMAMGGAIVASDLEQIGESLSPALTAADLKDQSRGIVDERAVLCTPGDVGEFVDAVVGLVDRPDLWAALGRNARRAVEQHYSWTRHVARLWPFMTREHAPEHLPADLPRTPPEPRLAFASVQGGAASARSTRPAGFAQQPQVATGDAYKDEVQRQWDNDPAGSHYVKAADPHTLAWFEEAESYRYREYAPWMAETMEFARHAGQRVLEIGGGMGTDLSQFARHGALVTDLDLSSGHLALAKENFRLRGLPGEFVLHDAESLVFDDNTFDLVYSNGVLHHTPNTQHVVSEIHRVLKPGGRAIVMMYAENSLHYWRNLVWAIGLKEGQLNQFSMGEIMSRSVERSDNAAARPLVKVYTRRRLRRLFEGFVDLEIAQRQMVAAEVPRLLTPVPLATLGRMMGWNLILKARKPRA
jgi:glycosyltransferase involved in cell wall biosynthesis/ubiquinone/menaquinone biosynthesis C-methylase UbiE